MTQGGGGAEPYDSYNHADFSWKYQEISGTTTVILNFVNSAGLQRCLVFFTAQITPRLSPGSDARKCMRERRGRVRLPLFQIQTSTALSGIFYGEVNAGGCNNLYFFLRRPEMYDS